MSRWNTKGTRSSPKGNRGKSGTGSGRGKQDGAPTWADITALRKKIEGVARRGTPADQQQKGQQRTARTTGKGQSTASTANEPQKAEPDHEARIASLKKMRAAATCPQDKAWATARISELTKEHIDTQDLAVRLTAIKQRLADKQDKLNRNMTHLAKVQEVVDSTRAEVQEAEAELAEVEAKLAQELSGSSALPSPAPPAAALMSACTALATALQRISCTAQAHGGCVTFTPEVQAAVTEAMSHATGALAGPTTARPQQPQQPQQPTTARTRSVSPTQPMGVFREPPTVSIADPEDDGPTGDDDLWTADEDLQGDLLRQWELQNCPATQASPLSPVDEEQTPEPVAQQAPSPSEAWRLPEAYGPVRKAFRAFGQPFQQAALAAPLPQLHEAA